MSASNNSVHRDSCIACCLGCLVLGFVLGVFLTRWLVNDAWEREAIYRGYGELREGLFGGQVVHRFQWKVEDAQAK